MVTGSPWRVESLNGPRCAWNSVIQLLPEPPRVKDPTDSTEKTSRRAAAMAWLRRTATPRRLMIAGTALGVPLGLGLLFFTILYVRDSRQIDRQMQAGVFADSVNIYAAPLYLSVGDQLGAEDLGEELEIAGYRQSEAGGPLTWRTRDGWVEIFPPGSASPARVLVTKGQIAEIRSAGREAGQIYLNSPLLTMLSTKKEERLPVTFNQIPPVLVKAILAAEDKRFFQHDGFDVRRIVKAAWDDLRDGRKEQGASTLTMQLVRGLWLDPHKRWMRKLSEAVLTVHLEHEWPKTKIFETYANEVYLGRRADYSVHGFGEGARLFFGRKLSEISLPEAALLAGMVQRPSYFNPFRWPARAKERRDLVLWMMRHDGFIPEDRYENAVREPIRLAGDAPGEARAPYFLDLVDDELQDRQAENARNGADPIRAVYTTVDLNLQHAADQAVEAGMKGVDALLARRSGKSGEKAEVALIALDPHTGEIKAVVGGRDYRKSQLDRILSKRPPGSVFKPFVYAAALETAISGGPNTYTPASMVDDSPTTFWFDGRPYQPANFRGEEYGNMTFEDALAHSDNIAAVKVAQEVGYDAVVRMARRFGLNDDIRPTPAVALGSYQVTPFEIARAYTGFANAGLLVQPRAIRSWRDADGDASPDGVEQAVRVLDPRIDWLMVNMLEEVLRSGTAAGVRARGFTLPAAGKTGTSHDGWFAGFTSRLLCVVWVGFDDYRDLGLEGAKSALPIWTDFMKRASRMAAYRNAKEFPMPNGITEERICLETGKPADDDCPNTRPEYFVAGTEPVADAAPQETAETPVIPAADPTPPVQP